MHVHARTVLRQCRSRFERQMGRLVERMLATADADPSPADEPVPGKTRTTTRADAASELRRRRREIEGRFRAALSEACSSCDRKEAEGPGLVNELALSVGSLDLRSDDALEEALAVQVLVDRTRASAPQELACLERRLGYCMGCEALRGDDDPFGPEAIGRALREAVALDGLALELRLDFYKLAEHRLVPGLTPLWHELNEMLAAGGVLPVLDVPAPADAGTAALSDAVPADLPRLAAVEDSALGSLTELLGLLRASAGWTSWGAAHGPAPERDAGAVPLPVEAGATLALPELLALLSDLQHRQEGAALLDGGGLRQVIGTALQARQLSIGSGEADVIDMVSMMFRFIHEDPNLNEAVKALLARLQIPFIKVALVDVRVFADKHHCARRFLNRLAELGLAVDREASDDDNPRLAWLRAAVARVLAEFDRDTELFDTLLAELDRFEADEQAAQQAALEALAASHRQREEAEGRAEVGRVVEAVLGKLAVPDEIAAIVRGTWSEVLLRTLRTAGEGQLWHDRVRFIHALARSVRPLHTSAQRQVFARDLPKLLGRLDEGLDFIGATPAQRAEILRQIEPYHLGNAVHPEAPTRAPEPPQPRPEPAEAGPTPAAPGADSAAPPDGPAPTTGGGGPLDELIAEMQAQLEAMSQLEALLSADDDLIAPESPPEPLRLDEDLFDPDIDTEAIAPASETVDEEWLETARAMELGTWVELAGHRVRLAWKSDLLGEFTFVNWKFQVVAERKVEALAMELRDGDCRVMASVPLLDRVLNAMVQQFSGVSLPPP